MKCKDNAMQEKDKVNLFTLSFSCIANLGLLSIAHVNRIQKQLLFISQNENRYLSDK